MLRQQVFVWSVQVLQPFGLYYGMNQKVTFHRMGIGYRNSLYRKVQSPKRRSSLPQYLPCLHQIAGTL